MGTATRPQRFNYGEWALTIDLPVVDCLLLTRRNFSYMRAGQPVVPAELSAEEMEFLSCREREILRDYAARNFLCFLAVDLPVSGVWGSAYAYVPGKGVITREIRGYELWNRWVDAFAVDHRKAIEHKAAREKWRAEEAARMKLPEVFVARSEADYYEPVVRGLLAPDIPDRHKNRNVIAQLSRCHYNSKQPEWQDVTLN